MKSIVDFQSPFFIEREIVNEQIGPMAETWLRPHGKFGNFEVEPQASPKSEGMEPRLTQLGMAEVTFKHFSTKPTEIVSSRFFSHHFCISGFARQARVQLRAKVCRHYELIPLFESSMIIQI